jgi:hypothetical protein
VVVLATTACQTVTMHRIKAASAGRTGCTPDQVTISNLRKLGEFTGNASWNAICNGKVYLCTVVQTGNNGQDYFAHRWHSRAAAATSNRHWRDRERFFGFAPRALKSGYAPAA